VAGLAWPGVDAPGNRRDELTAWGNVIGLARRLLTARLLRRPEPVLVMSHAAPEGVGDAPDAYHRGFRSYRWLLDRFRPPVWLHGHTTLASIDVTELRHGPTTVVNVTGAVLLELDPPEG
jgi:Icc-related predicted phosphoesterase